MSSRQKKLTHNTLSGFFWLFSGAGAQSVLQFLVLIILARLVSPEEFGVVNIAMIVIGFSMVFSQLGVGPAIVQKNKLEEQHIRSGFTLSLILGLLFSLVLVLFSPFVSNFFRIEELWSVLFVLSLVFPLQGISLVSEALMQRELKFIQLAIVQVVAYFFGYGLAGITLGLMGFGVWALVGAHVLQNLIKTFLLTILRPHPKRLNFNVVAIKELLYFGGGFTLAKIANYLALHGDSLVIGRFLGPSALGIYGRVYQLIMMPANLFGQVIDKVLFPVMAKIQDEPLRLIKAYQRGTSIVALFILPLTPILIILAPEIIMVILGNTWIEATSPFQILAMGMFFRTSYKISDSLIRAKGAVYRRAWRQSIYAAAVLIGAFVGHFWGLSGVTYGILIALLVNYLLITQLSLRLTAMTWWKFFNSHIHGLLMGIIIFAEVWLIVPILRGLEVWPVLTILISLGAAGITLIGIIYFAPGFFLGKDGIWIYKTIKSFIALKLGKRPGDLKLGD